MPDREKALLFAGIIIGGMLGVFGNLVVTLFWELCLKTQSNEYQWVYFGISFLLLFGFTFLFYFLFIREVLKTKDSNSNEPLPPSRKSTIPKKNGTQIYSTNRILWAIALIYFTLFIPYNYLDNPLKMTMSDIYNIIIALALLGFTAIQVRLTNLQYDMEYKKNQIEDLRNNLEKGLGPIYSIMNFSPLITKGVKTKEGSIDLKELESEINEYKIISLDEKKIINEILSKYPHMFNKDVLNLWKTCNQSKFIEELNHLDDTKEIPHIPIRFRELINEEYDKILSEYNKLLGK